MLSKATIDRLDWTGLMRVGIRTLGLKPAEFWALTPAELAFMVGVGGVTPSMSRSRLRELSEKFPDGAQTS